VLAPPANAVVVKVNWSDNPWFPDVLRAEKDALKAKDPTPT
jgi:phage terminase large subunit